MEPPRWIPAAVGSLTFHVVVLLLLYAAGGLHTYRPRATAIASNIRKVTPLYAPRELTQKAPNRGHVAKEVNVEDLTPRSPSEENLPPAPAARTFRRPFPQPGLPEQAEPPKTAEPPKLEAQNSARPALPAPAGTPKAPPPPKIEPEEKPKLAFETPGRQGPSPDKTAGQSKLETPKATVEEAVKKQ